MAVRHHRLDVYDVHLHIATSRKDYATLRRRYPKIQARGASEFGSVNRFMLTPTSGPDQSHVIVFIDTALHRGDQGALLDTCAHEAAHAALGILENCGAEYDKDSEPAAHLFGWLTRFIWEAT